MKRVGDRTTATPSRQAGAVQSKTGLSDRIDAWFAHHSTSAIESLLKLLRTPLQSLMTWLVVAIAVALPATLFTTLLNLQYISEQWQGSNQVSVFLQRDIQQTALLDLREKFQTHHLIASLVYISPEEALTEFKTHSGLGRIVDSLDTNPLPGVFVLQPTTQNPSALEELQRQLLSEPLIAEVRIDMQWIKRLQQLMILAERVVMALSGLLGLGLILIVGNTVRLAIESRREEILVIKLVGGTDAYIRRPLLYTGLWFGLGGGIFAAALLTAGLYWLAEPVNLLADLYQSEFRLQGLGLAGNVQLILLAGVLGVVGAWLAVSRHLSLIEPQ